MVVRLLSISSRRSWREAEREKMTSSLGFAQVRDKGLMGWVVPFDLVKEIVQRGQEADGDIEFRVCTERQEG